MLGDSVSEKLGQKQTENRNKLEFEHADVRSSPQLLSAIKRGVSDNLHPWKT